jgi:hypothetical protein
MSKNVSCCTESQKYDAQQMYDSNQMIEINGQLDFTCLNLKRIHF